MNEVREMFAKGAFFFIVGVILASLFIWCLMQGVIIHLGGDASTPVAYYFAAWLAGVGGFTLYMQAKGLFHYAKISKE